MDSYGILSILPIVVTIVISLKFRNIVFALFSGSFVGLMIMNMGNPITSMSSFVKDFLIPMITDTYSAEVLALLLFISGFVKLMEVSGGAQAFATAVSKMVNSRFKAQICCWISGFIVFFSDIGNPIIVGPIFQPLFDKLKISREKLAWIIDTTASPVSILIPFLGWGAYIMGLLGQEFQANGLALSEWDTLLKVFPLQLYALLSLLLVPLVAFTGKEFGPMFRAEERVQTTGQLAWPGSEVVKKQEKPIPTNASPLVMIIPLVVMIGTLVGMLAPEGFPFKPVDGDNLRAALITGFLFGAVANILLCGIYKIKPMKEAIGDYVVGMEEVASIFIVLLMAWVMSGVTKAMGAPEFVVQIAEAAVPAWLLPGIIFLACAIISFSTGSSWGTFTIGFTIAIPAAMALDSPFYACLAAVLSGGLFGDHCSPISDTTVLSGTGASCNLLDHVTTQIPYALLCGSVAFVGFIIAGLIGGSYVTLPIAVVILLVVFAAALKIYGRKVHNTVVDTDAAGV